MAPRILVVDDDPDMVTTCAQILTQHGYACLTAGSGAAAIARLDTERPELVVCDLHMPEVDGLAVARHAHTRVPPIPVILMTAWPVDPASVSEQRLAGAAVHLAKPFANAELVETVRRVLGEARLEHALAPGIGGRARS